MASESRSSSSSNTLLCPQCGYNVTGTASERCPECGRPFDRDELAREQANKMISGDVIWSRLLIPAGLCFLASIIPFVSFFTMPIAALVVVIWGGVNAWEMANRLSLTRAVRSGASKESDGAFVGWTFAGLWLAHLAIAAFAIVGGCAVSWGLAGIASV